MNHYVIYARKSSDREDRQILSVDAQIAELKKVAEHYNLTIKTDDILREEKTAKAPGRPVFNQMMYDVVSGKIQGVLCWKLDRLARNSLDGGTVIWAIKNHGLTIYTPSEIYNLDKDNAFMMYVEFGFAQKFIDDLSKNVKRGLRAKATAGWLPTGAKPGYMNDKAAEKGCKTVLKDPIRFPLIRKAWDSMLTGMYTPPQVVNMLNNDWGYRTPTHKKIGGKPMTRSMIYRVLTDPFYYGEFIYQGETYKGKHEPMITREEFGRVQTIMGKRGNPRPKNGQRFYAVGLLRCGECGAAITAEEKHQIICSQCKYKFAYLHKDSCPKCHIKIAGMNNPTRLLYTYYHCTKRKDASCSQKSITQAELDSQINRYLDDIQLPEKYSLWAIKYLNEVNSQEENDRKYTLAALQTAYKDVCKRIDNLTTLKISPQNTDGSLMSDGEYKSQKQRLIEEKSALDGKLATHSERIDHWLDYTEKAFKFAVHASRWFNAGTVETKKYILAGIGSNLILKDEHLRIQFASPFNYIKQLQAVHEPNGLVFEPTKKTSLSTNKDSSVGQNLSGLPG